MIDNNSTTQPERVRVSIFERIVPLAAFGLAAAAGGIGGWTIISLITAIAQNENAGKAALSGGLAEYTIYPLVFLYAACALGVVGICVAIGRMVITTSTASPSGVSFIVPGILSLVPIALVWNAGGMIMGIFDGTAKVVAGEFGSTIAAYCTAAMIAAPIILFVLLAWAVIPFRARPGRRFGPLIALVVMEIVLVVVAVMFQLRVAELWRINQTMG
jgi:hypothetical protein